MEPLISGGLSSGLISSSKAVLRLWKLWVLSFQKYNSTHFRILFLPCNTDSLALGPGGDPGSISCSSSAVGVQASALGAKAWPVSLGNRRHRPSQSEALRGVGSTKALVPFIFRVAARWSKGWVFCKTHHFRNGKYAFVDGVWPGLGNGTLQVFWEDGFVGIKIVTPK